MIAELIKLSKELYELEMIDDSYMIDEMIEKLYGVASNQKVMPEDLCEQHGSLSDGEIHDNIKDYIGANASVHTFKNEIASMIYDSFEESDVEEIRNLLTDYLGQT